MNYIGSKNKLSSFIEDAIKSIVGNDLSDKIFCDIFAGTGIIGRKFKSKPFKKLLIDIQDKSMEEQYEILDNTIEDWKGAVHEQIDDILVIGIKI